MRVLNLLSKHLKQYFTVQCNNIPSKSVVVPGRISPTRKIPDFINRPKFGYEIDSTYEVGSNCYSNDEIEGIKKACYIAKSILSSCKDVVKIGVTTDEIDEFAHNECIKLKAYPSPLHYKGFPKSVCTSVNNVACHGIPDDRKLENGEIINVDVTVYYNGFHGDCSDTFMVGEVDEIGNKLIQTTKESVYSAINACAPGVEFNIIGKIIEKIANKNDFAVIPAFCGHGIGKFFHQYPEILHFDNDFPGTMEAGMVFTIEPIISEKGIEIEILEDCWTAVTVDSSRSAQYEHTICITQNGVDILTKLQ